MDLFGYPVELVDTVHSWLTAPLSAQLTKDAQLLQSRGPRQIEVTERTSSVWMEGINPKKHHYGFWVLANHRGERVHVDAAGWNTFWHVKRHPSHWMSSFEVGEKWRLEEGFTQHRWVSPLIPVVSKTGIRGPVLYPFSNRYVHPEI